MITKTHLSRANLPILCAFASAVFLTSAANGQVTLTDIGSTAPTPGTNDIYQLGGGGGEPSGLNYYWDDGATTPTTGYPSQTFTTSNNPQGYVLTSIAIQTAGGGGGGNGGPTESQNFTLLIFRMNGSGSGTGLTNATLIGSYTVAGQLQAEGDWMQWTGLGTSLLPGTNYGFAFGRAVGSPGDWEEISAASGLPYSGGQACLIANAGGKVKYSSSANNYDMTFDIGLALPAAPVPGQPIESPSTANIAVLAGTNVTLTASAGGSTPIYYQWQTDGGASGGLTNIPGATNAVLSVNTAGWLPGTYNFDFVARNSLGTNSSSAVSIQIVSLLMADIGPNAPTPGPNDISQLLNSQQSDDGFNYYTDNGANHNEWNGQTFTTGNSPSGYVLNSLAWKSAGNGNNFPAFQYYDLYIYALSANGTTATQIGSYQAYGGGKEDDWFEWVGLNTPLAPNSLYAYALGRDGTASGWEHIGDQGGNPYSGGQLCQIPSQGGTVTYGGAGTSDATFDIGLAISQAPFATVPAYTPAVTPVYAGTPLTLIESAVGAPPLSYQWEADNGTGTLSLVGGGTSSNLVVDTTGFAPGNYEYAVIVTNAHGASTSATLTVTVVAASAPQLVADISPLPANEGYVGQTLSYSAAFVGTLPISYQWMLDTGSGPSPISSAANPTATNSTLVLSNVQTAQAGTYTLLAANTVGSAPSSSSALIVLPAPAAPAANTYGAAGLSDGPVAYWRFNETNDPSTGILPAYDATGHNYDGLYGANSQNSFNEIAGPQPPAFPGFETNNGAFASANALTNSWVTLPPLNLDTNAVTITLWIYPNSTEPTFGGLFFNRNNTDAAGIGFGGTQNASGMAELGYTWNTNNGDTWGFNSGLYPPMNQWSFVALVVQPTQATLYLYYIDPNTGQPDLLSSINAIAHGPEAFSGGTTAIGTDPADLNTRAFSGNIDEVAVFQSALTSDQILSLFGKGSGVSAVAPSIVTQPASQAYYAGTTVTFAASGINGNSPFSYQWQFDGTNLAGATTPSLTLSNVTLANAGTYQLFVTNPVGVTASSNATLEVVVPAPHSYASAVIDSGALLYWALNETNDPSTGTAIAYDYIHGIDGVYQTASQNGFDGVLGPQAPAFLGFPSNNTALETFANIPNSYVTASAGTLVATNLTYVMWIDPATNVENWAGLLMDRGGVGEGLGFGGDVSDSGMSDLGYTWNQNSTWSFSTYLFPPTNEWSLVALAIEPTEADIYLINSAGVQTAVNPIAHDAEEFGVAWHIGNDAQDGGNGGRTFPGSIAAVSVYLSTLSSNQIVSLYDAGLQVAPPVTLNAVPGPGRTLVLSWSQGSLLQATNLLGPWVTNTAASPYSVAETNAQMFYKVRVQ